MAIATLSEDGKRIIVKGQAAELRYVSRIPGAKHRPNDPDWMLPPTLDSCSELQSQRIPLSETLTAYAEKLQRIQRYIEKVKLKDGAVEPLQPIPIKKPYSLYQHQVKAYNIALALFGRGARKGGSQ